MAKPVKLTLEQQIAAQVIRTRKAESELDNVKDLYLKLAARVLRLELVVSAMDTDGSLMEILRPSKEAEEV